MKNVSKILSLRIKNFGFDITFNSHASIFKNNFQQVTFKYKFNK